MKKQNDVLIMILTVGVFGILNTEMGMVGMANILGSMLAGRLLTKNANKTVAAFPFFLGALYLILFLVGELTMPTAVIVFIWGVLGGIGANINQYWVFHSGTGSAGFC